MTDKKINKKYLSQKFHISHRKTPEAYRSHRHIHDAYELLLCNKGSGNFFIKNYNYKIKDHSLFIINKYNIHLPMINNDIKIFDRFVIQYKAELFNNFFNFNKDNFNVDSVFSKDIHYIKLNKQEHNFLKSLSEKILYENTKKKSSYKLLTNIYLLEQLIYIDRLLLNKDIKNSNNNKNSRLKKIIDFINKNYYNDLTLDIIADEFFISKYYLCKYFKNNTGFTVINFINKKRIIEAQKLLKTTNKNITEIAFEVGFNSLNHFERIFKKTNGITASQYKNIYINN